MIASSLIDIGINLAHDSFNPDRDVVIARAVEAGVVQMIVTGSNGPSTRDSIELARCRPGQLFATAGVHPHYSKELSAELLAELHQLATRPEVVAVGECGLDYFRDLSPRPVQQQAFHRQLELAALVKQARLPSPARRTRGLRRHPARAPQGAHGRCRALLYGHTGRAAGVSRYGSGHRHHRLDLRRTARVRICCRS